MKRVVSLILICMFIITILTPMTIFAHYGSQACCGHYSNHTYWRWEGSLQYGGFRKHYTNVYSHQNFYFHYYNSTYWKIKKHYGRMYVKGGNDAKTQYLGYRVRIVNAVSIVYTKYYETNAKDMSHVFWPNVLVKRKWARVETEYRRGHFRCGWLRAARVRICTIKTSYPAWKNNHGRIYYY